MQVLGIDIGGSGIKGAPVDTETGELLAERYRIPTPQPSTPEAVAEVIAEIARHFDWKGPIGCGFPAVVQGGITKSAANVDETWVDADAAGLISTATGCPTKVFNDADVAGLAEMAFGAGKGRKGGVLVITIGTGLGSSLFTDGVLLPNTELGHIEFNGQDAEWAASDAARKREDLSWKKWGKRFDDYLNYLHKLFWPDLIILGGGASKKFEKFSEFMTVPTELVTAETLNEAGIIGAALAGQP
jgi:polyphosphate glucokinase